MKLSVSFLNLLTIVFLLQCIHFVYVNGDCPAGWSSFTDSNGIEYGYQVVLKNNVSYFEARRLCLDINSEIVDIHTREENEYMYSLAANTSAQNLFIGMHYKLNETSRTSEVYCTWTPDVKCDFAYFQNQSDPRRQQYPWVPIPKAQNNGNPVECVEITDTSLGIGTPVFMYNDIACADRLDGAVCKMTCSNGNNPATTFGSSTTINGQNVATISTTGSRGNNPGPRPTPPTITAGTGAPGLPGSPGLPGLPGSGGNNPGPRPTPPTRTAGTGAPGLPGGYNSIN
uniref:C-type lectin domain-containing protein n=1 Tax=Meloidogyne javanica TaxID=6303 RepID=A0A915LC86_MELJA